MFPYVTFSKDKTWQPGPYAGVELMVLHKNEATGGVTVLRKFKAGITVPAHIHPQASEFVYVLSGEWEESGVTYAVGTLFFAPVAATFFADTFFQDDPGTKIVKATGFTSPFSATFNVPLDVEQKATADLNNKTPIGDWPLVAAYGSFTVGLNIVLLGMMMWLFNTRWRVSG